MAYKIDFFLMGLQSPSVAACFQGVYNSFFRALEEIDCVVTYSTASPDKNADVLVVPLGGEQDQSSAKAMHEFGGPVILYVPPAKAWFRRGFLERWKDRILFAYSTDCSEYSPRAYKEIGIRYYHFPFASEPSVMRPLELPKLYDVVFVGNAGSGKGRYHYIDCLMQRLGSRRLLLLGSGWERYGFPVQQVAWGDLLNVIYNLSHICINISNNEQNLGMDLRVDANNRLFDLALSGCFQLSNAPLVVRPYFDETQVLAFDDIDEWISSIEYYLDHPAETESFRDKARKRVLAEHTWQQRSKQFVNLIESHLSVWQSSSPTSSRWSEIVRIRDTVLPP